MNFFESIKQGVVGLLLFAGNWILPQEDNAALSMESIKKITPPAWEISIKLEMSLNRQLEELIDAGIPLNFRFTAVSDNADTVAMVRSLRCNVADLTYAITDSSAAQVTTSKKYPMILLAVRDFSRWKFRMSAGSSSCAIEAEILYSTVSQLNRSVDMSRIWGHQKVRTTVALKEEKQ